MAIFLVFGYVIIAIPFFKKLFRIILISTLVTQFTFTLFSSALDVIFNRIRRFRPLYIVLFLIAPVLHACAFFELYTGDIRLTIVEFLEKAIAPFTFDEVQYLFFIIVGLLIMWLGKASRESRYTDCVLSYFLMYVMMLLIPATGMFGTVRLSSFHCHRTLAAIYKNASGLLGTVLLAAVGALLAALPIVAGRPSPSAYADDDDEEEEEQESGKPSETPKEESEQVAAGVPPSRAAKGKSKGKAKRKVE